MILLTASSTDETIAFRTTCSTWATMLKKIYKKPRRFQPEHQIGFSPKGLRCHKMTSTFLVPKGNKQWLSGTSIFLPGKAPWVQRRPPEREITKKARISKLDLQEPGLRRVCKVLDGVDRLLGPQLGAVLALTLPAHLINCDELISYE